MNRLISAGCWSWTFAVDHGVHHPALVCVWRVIGEKTEDSFSLYKIDMLETLRDSLRELREMRQWLPPVPRGPPSLLLSPSLFLSSISVRSQERKPSPQRGALDPPWQSSRFDASVDGRLSTKHRSGGAERSGARLLSCRSLLGTLNPLAETVAPRDRWSADSFVHFPVLCLPRRPPSGLGPLSL